MRLDDVARVRRVGLDAQRRTVDADGRESESDMMDVDALFGRSNDVRVDVGVDECGSARCNS